MLFANQRSIVLLTERKAGAPQSMSSEKKLDARKICRYFGSVNAFSRRQRNASRLCGGAPAQT